jgi:hypothetical protein
MNKRLLYITLAIISVLIVIVAVVFLAGPNNKDPSATTIGSPLPITVIFLDGSTIHFHCLDGQKCFTDVDLGEQIRAANNPDTHPLRIGFAYYGKDSTLYILLVGAIGQYLAKVNLITEEAQILDPAPFIGGLFPGMSNMVHGKLVLATVDGKIGIVQDDFSVKTIDLKAPILDFIEANNSKIAAISTSSLLQDGTGQANIFLVDVNTDEIEKKILNSPQQGSWWFVGVDQDIKHLFWLPAGNNATYSNVLNVFDLQAQKDDLSVPISNFDALTYTTQTAKRYQYRGIWYYSRRRAFLEGPYPAMMMDMSTLKQVINPDDFLKNEANAILMISPFGDNFLIGTNSQAFMVSPNGKIIQRYSLPKDWIGKDYLFLEYRK